MFDTVPLKLSLLKKGDRCIIASFIDEDLQLKLMEMGCIPGEHITIERLAPFGDPMAIQVSGYTLSIRLDEAASVMVTRDNPDKKQDV